MSEKNTHEENITEISKDKSIDLTAEINPDIYFKTKDKFNDKQFVSLYIVCNFNCSYLSDFRVQTC